MEETLLSEDMIKLFTFVKESYNEGAKKGLKDIFEIMEAMNEENEILIKENCRLEQKIDEKKRIIEAKEQENFRLIAENRKTLFEKIKDILRSEKSGF